MGPRPKKPPPLGLAPKVGFEHPKFPTIGQKEPEGTYRSQIDTARPIGPAITRSLLDVANPTSGLARRATDAMFSSNSGDASRSAFARSLTDTTRNAMARGVNEFETEYSTQAEKSRAEDVLAQRQNVFDTFRLNKLYDVFGEDVNVGFGQKVKDLSAYYERERKNSQAMITASFMRMLGGLI